MTATMSQPPVPRILLVDDEPSIRQLLSYRLKREGYEVTVARSGKEALAKAEEENFDIDAILSIGTVNVADGTVSFADAVTEAASASHPGREKADAAGSGRTELFPVTDEDVLPIRNPLIIQRPPRFANKREMGLVAGEAVQRLLEANSGLLEYVTVKQWVEILTIAVDLLREKAENEFQWFFSSQTVLYGATVANRTVHAMWSYPEDVQVLEFEIKRMQEELKTRKKMAELQG